MKQIPLDRQILALTDEQLEIFVREWLPHKKQYVLVERFTGTGDMGRDVVGYLTAARLEGSWHNYQCKQYGRTLSTATALAELGKVLYYSHEGEFTAPSGFYFVAPRGVNRNLKRLIAKPSELKAELIEKWDEYCAESITEKQRTVLTPSLRSSIQSWDFSSVRSISVDEILEDPDSKPVLQAWFGVDPGPAPMGAVPNEIEVRELRYIQELLAAYGERDGCDFDKSSVRVHDVHGPHLNRQRERFFDADSFSRFYRDNTMQEEIDVLRRDIMHGVVEVHDASHTDALDRANAVMTQAANVQASGALARHARVAVKQGLCHHFVNEGTLKWRKS